jgi:hypothetical protein
MTIGAWFLGGALFAWESLRLRQWSLTYNCLLYLWSFSLAQAVLLLVYRQDFKLDAPLAWPYLATLTAGSLCAVAGVVEAVRLRPALSATDERIPAWLRAVPAAFVLFVGFLAVVLLSGLSSGASLYGYPLAPLTAHAFGAFYLALGLSALPLVWARNVEASLPYQRSGLALTVLLVIAAAVYHDVFDPSAHPAAILYVGAYVVVGAVTLAFLLHAHALPLPSGARRR